MEDLDSLLEDLGRGKSNTTAKKQRPPSSRVDLNELEDLMEDLAAPTSKQAPAPAPVVIPAFSAPTPVKEDRSSGSSFSHSNGSSAESNSSVEDLNDLLNQLTHSATASNSGNRRSKQASSVNLQPQVLSPEPVPPKQNTYTPPANPPPKQNFNSPPAPKENDLDNLLKNLTTQMNSIDGDNPASRGTCGTCRQAILGEIIQALGKTYHPEHFACGNCRDPLGTRNFYEQNGTPYCEKCFQELYCAKCAHCDKPVLDRCITALGKKWHVDHFICTQCLKPFAGGNFFERDGRPYCEADFYALFAPKCAACNDPIRGDCINALGSQWHPEHFACTYCQKSFAGGSFYESGGKPYCETHYHQQTGSLCSGCGKPITGRCVNALDKKWHPEHFVCAFCMNPLAGGSFTEHNSKAYCRECHGKLFGSSS